MQYKTDVEFTHRGHHVLVSHKTVLAETQGIIDTMFVVLVDGAKTDVPGIWSAYKKASIKGVELVIMALLDGRPALSHVALVS